MRARSPDKSPEIDPAQRLEEKGLGSQATERPIENQRQETAAGWWALYWICWLLCAEHVEVESGCARWGSAGYQDTHGLGVESDCAKSV